MKTFVTFFFFIPFVLYGQTAWSPPITIEGPTIDWRDILYCYSDYNGNHIVINTWSNGTIRYIRLGLDGEFKYERQIDTDCTYTGFDIFTYAITGYQNELYLVYLKGTKIKVAKSDDIGDTWDALTEKDIGNTDSDGIDAVYDEKGLHVVWGVMEDHPGSSPGYETYYERYRRQFPSLWVENKKITDEPWTWGCGRPSIALSENRIHVTYNYECINFRTRDYNFVTTEWEPSQLILHETPPPPGPGWTVVDFINWGGGRVAVLDNYLHALEYIHVVAEVPGGGEFSDFIYLYDNKRLLSSNEWGDDMLLTKFTTGYLLPRFVNTGGKLHTIVRYSIDIEIQYLLYFNFYENSWHGPSIIIDPDPTFHLCYSGNNQSIYVYWSEYGSNQLHYSYSLQNPVIPLVVNPFLDKQNDFFNYEPEVLSKLKNIDTSISSEKEGE